MNIQRIGFIGTGVMGSGMIRNLQKAGYPVNINTRTKAKAEKLIQEGGRWFDSQAELAAQSDIVITMVGYPQDVEAVYFGDQGIFHGKQGGFVIDMTTSSPSLAKRIYAQAKKQGIDSQFPGRSDLHGRRHPPAWCHPLVRVIPFRPIRRDLYD